MVSPPRRRPVAIDLFAGAGGLSLGFEQAGFDVLAALEYDPVHAATHLYNFPHTEVICRDASKITPFEIRDAARRSYRRLHRRDWDGRIDAVIGGPPCQGFSLGGKGDVDDERNDMLMTFAQLVVALRPRVFCIENVSGLLGVKYKDVLGATLTLLTGAGYSISGHEKPVNAKNFGVPQSRSRVFILGALDGDAPTLEPSGPLVTVAEAFAGLPHIENFQSLLDSDSVMLPTTGEKSAALVSEYSSKLAGLVGDPSDLSHPRVFDRNLLSGSRRTIHSTDTLGRFSRTAPGEVEPKSRLFRLDPAKVARTVRAGTGSERGAHTSPRPIHPNRDRVITVREAARLHGYPDWFRFHTTNWHGHRQVGNSVPPPLAKAAATALIASLGERAFRGRAIAVHSSDSLLRMARLEAADYFGASRSEIPASRRVAT